METFTREKRTFNSTKTKAEPMAASLTSQLQTAQNLLNQKTGRGVPSTTSTTVKASDVGTSPLNIPDVPTPSVTTGNLGVATDSTMAGATTDAAYEPPENPQKAEAQGYLQKILGNIGTQAEDVNQIYEEEKLADKKQKAQKLSTELDIMDKAYRDEVKAIKENPEGKFGGAIQQDVNLATDRYQNNRANAALVYKVAAEDYNGAAEIVNQKVQALSDQNDSYLQAYQLLIESVNNDMTESEQLQAQEMYRQKAEDRKIITDTYSAVLNSAVQNQAPASVLSAIDAAAKAPGATAASIASAAGQYGADILERQIQQAQLQKLKSETAKIASEVGDGTDGSVSSITQSVINNPSLFDDLTPTVKGKVISELQANGYDTSNIGVKGLSDTAIASLAQTQKALSDLDELKVIIQNNEDLVGPITGLQRYNPYSKARKIQADVDRVRQTVGKALEGGVLRKEDEEKYKKILATLADTPSTALYKVDALIGSIQRDIETYKSLQLSGGRSLDVGASLQKSGDVLSEEELRKKYGY